MTGLVSGAGYGTGSFFSNIVGRVSPAVSGVYGVLTNPYFLAVIFFLVVVVLVSGDD